MQPHFMHNHAHETAGAASAESSTGSSPFTSHLRATHTFFDFEDVCVVAAPRPRVKYGGERCVKLYNDSGCDTRTKQMHGAESDLAPDPFHASDPAYRSTTTSLVVKLEMKISSPSTIIAVTSPFKWT